MAERGRSGYPPPPPPSSLVWELMGRLVDGVHLDVEALNAGKGAWASTRWM